MEHVLSLVPDQSGTMPSGRWLCGAFHRLSRWKRTAGCHQKHRIPFTALRLKVLLASCQLKALRSFKYFFLFFSCCRMEGDSGPGIVEVVVVVVDGPVYKLIGNNGMICLLPWG